MIQDVRTTVENLNGYERLAENAIALEYYYALDALLDKISDSIDALELDVAIFEMQHPELLPDQDECFRCVVRR